MNNKAITVSRTIGIDSHPDSFTAAVLIGDTPATAIVQNTYNKVPMRQLSKWAQKSTTTEDLIVLEASGNSFEVVRTLAKVKRQALVLESCQLGKLKDTHANNDKISAVRIGKAYLAGTAKEVWVPDPLTQERRDWMHAHRKVVKRETQMSNRLGSYLSDNGVRLESNSPLLNQQESIKAAKQWSPRQWQVIAGMFLELQHSQEQRAYWEALMAQEVMENPLLLSLTRLCGIRDQVAFAAGAVIGDIKRFANPKKLVKYLGLNPGFDESGKDKKSKRGVGGHGRRDLRCLLTQSAQAIMRTKHPLARWGKKLLARKGIYNLAVAAVARKLAIAIWYLMMGRWSKLEQIEKSLKIKVGKMISKIGEQDLKKMGKSRKDYREEVFESLINGRIYVLKEPPKCSSKTT